MNKINPLMGRLSVRAPHDAGAKPLRWLSRCGAAIAALAAGVCGVYPAQADEVAKPGELVEIVVTAQRRSENLQDVPIAVTALTGAALGASGIVDTQSLEQVVPGLNFSQQGSAARPYLRGVGTEFGVIGIEPSVAMYIDDVYIPGAVAQLFNLNNVTSIDVLRGPQGTLFGRNATGGVIQIRTADPSDKASGDFYVGGGSYGTYQTAMYATVPLTNTLFFNVSAAYDDRTRGWGTDLTTGNPTHLDRSDSATAKLVWQPSDATKVRLEYVHSYDAGQAGLALNGVYNVPNRPAITQVNGLPFAGYYNDYDLLDDRSLAIFDMGSLKIDQDFGFANFVSISAYQKFQGGLMVLDQDASPYGISLASLPEPYHTITQEFQLLSPDKSLIKWIVGAFYFHDDAGFEGGSVYGTGTGFPYPNSAYLGLNDLIRTRSYAGFGQATAPIFADTHLTLGVRYTHDSRDASGGFSVNAVGTNDVLANLTNTAPGRSFTGEKVTYRVALDHNFTPDFLGYVSYNTGYKSGAFDPFGFAAPGTDPDGRSVTANPVKPETIRAVEVGLKTEWFDHRLRANISGFHYNIGDPQLLTTKTPGTELINAGSAEVNGAELELHAQVLENVMLNAGFSAQHGKYTSFPNGPTYAVIGGATTGINGNLTGNTMINTPDVSASIGADYNVPTSIGNVVFNVQYSYTASFYWEPDDSLSQPAYNIVNLSSTWYSIDEKFSLKLWANNVTGTEYSNYASVVGGVGPFYSAAAPRTYGVLVGLHF